MSLCYLLLFLRRAESRRPLKLTSSHSTRPDFDSSPLSDTPANPSVFLAAELKSATANFVTSLLKPSYVFITSQRIFSSRTDSIQIPVSLRFRADLPFLPSPPWPRRRAESRSISPPTSSEFSSGRLAEERDSTGRGSTEEKPTDRAFMDQNVRLARSVTCIPSQMADSSFC